ncbi:MAG: DUF222 domain-containing protein [bacterium]|nr:DUF222 domain-containing protein [bacterium]
MDFTSVSADHIGASHTEARQQPNGAGSKTHVGCEAFVCVDRADVAALSDTELRQWLGELGSAGSKLEALRAEALAELSRRHNTGGAKRVVREVLRSSPSAAHRDVRSAERMTKLADTSDALASGQIPTDHARLIARASSEGPIIENDLVEAAKTQSFDEFSRTVKRQQHALSADDGQSQIERQRKHRSAKLFKNHETGMYVLNAELDSITGANIAGALANKERQFWHQEKAKNRRTPAQRSADALAELILHPEKGKVAGIALVLVADYDTAHQKLIDARISDGTPLPAKELVRLACEADIFPAVFKAKTQDLWLGRRRRCASDAQRLALLVRDKTCVGCGADANRSFSHHIRHWQNGGETNYSNLVTVCNDCHHDIHERHHQIQTNPHTGKHSVLAPPEPFPDGGSSDWQPAQRNPVLRN